MVSLPYQLHDEDRGLLATFQAFEHAASFGALLARTGPAPLLLEVREAYHLRWLFTEDGKWAPAPGQEAELQLAGLASARETDS